MGLVGDSSSGLRVVAADGWWVVRLVKAIAAAIGLALLLWGTGCAHRYQSHQTATRTEETRQTWQTAETAASNTQSTAVEKKQGSRTTKRFRPDGTLMEQVSEQWGSDGRVQVSSAASSSASATGADFASVRASSSSTKASSTETRLPWLRIGLGIVVAALLVFCYFRFRAKWTASFRRLFHI